MATSSLSSTDEMHKLSNNWTIYAHLPHDTDWRLASYKTLFSDDTFEVRLYDPVLKAKTFSSEGSNNNFGKLFRYISGYNQKNEKIAMTTPVYMSRKRRVL